MLKLTYSNLEFQIFPGEDPRTPSSRGGKGGEEREGKGKDREGTGEGRRGGMGGGGQGRGGALDMGSPPRDKSSGSAPGQSCCLSQVAGMKRTQITYVCTYCTSGFRATKFCKEKKIIFGLGRTYSTVDELKQFQRPLFWDPNIYTPRSMA